MALLFIFLFLKVLNSFKRLIRDTKQCGNPCFKTYIIELVMSKVGIQEIDNSKENK